MLLSRRHSAATFLADASASIVTFQPFSAFVIFRTVAFKPGRLLLCSAVDCADEKRASPRSQPRSHGFYEVCLAESNSRRRCNGCFVFGSFQRNVSEWRCLIVYSRLYHNQTSSVFGTFSDDTLPLCLLHKPWVKPPPEIPAKKKVFFADFPSAWKRGGSQNLGISDFPSDWKNGGGLVLNEL